MRCVCGQESTTTHACWLLASPVCWCGQPSRQTHTHFAPAFGTWWTIAEPPGLLWPWWHFAPRPIPATPNQKGTP